ncbi:unnamed protein product [Rotaria sp. Silwood2]|nr:unnamed protein product [Rotaria sp. Silwood2]CAF2899239.1 unnamed protein product [Rotaria sp. Silwood2]CAF3252132.1 unnamed protein product [Rotaria sp. Silwood2]CAF4281974.1 unnamed protein product [Rotaria sp. Silwood2]CAF4332996.1 unnamed protein product [Rotaria sp. Silwood2]
MATSTSNKPRCATCAKVTGTFICYGCSQNFCLVHVNEHRQSLIKQLDEEVVIVHDQLKQNFNENTTKPRQHPLMKQIDEWEQRSIEKIQQTANNARKQLLNAIQKHMDNIKDSLTLLTQQLSKLRDDDAFFEIDIKEWKEKLIKFKKEMDTPETVKIRNDNISPFISKILIDETSSATDIFERSDGKARIEDNGRSIIHIYSANHAPVRCKSEYTSGQHRFRFRIEELGRNKWILFAIVSKDAVIMHNSYSTPTTYGWAGLNQVFLNGVCKNGFNGYKSDMEKNDTIEFYVDCDQRKIRLKNERTNSTYELDVDVAQSPFPWQLSLNLADPGDRVCLVS